MKKLFFIPASIILLAFYQQSCTNDNEEDLFPECDSINVTYSETIYKILENSGCYNCHNQQGVAFHDVKVDHYEGLKAVVDDGRFYNVTHHTPGSPQMPQGGEKIDDCNLAKIRKWIDDGAPNN